MFFHMYIAPAQGQTIPSGQKIDANKKALSLSSFVANLKKKKKKKKLFQFWFYI